MRAVFFAATPCLFLTLITSNCLGQRLTEPDRHLIATSTASPSIAQPSAASALDTLFDPVPFPPGSSSPGTVTCALPTAPAVASGAATAASSPVLSNSGASPAVAPFAGLPMAPKPRPDSRKRFIFVNSIMYGATVFNAFGRQQEVDACKAEAGVRNGVYLIGVYKGQAPATQSRFYAISLPIDAGVTLLSALARHKGWRTLEIAGPLSAASAHITAGAFKLSAGCY